MADIKNPALGGLSGLAGLLNPIGNSTTSKKGLTDLLLARPEVRGLYYNGQTIRLDGYTWVGCRFDNCTLEVITTNFELVDCIVDSTNQAIYGSAVLKIIQLFCSRYPWSNTVFKPWFLPETKPNGSISIKDNTP